MSVAPVDSEQMYKLEKLFIEKICVFKWHSEEYSTGIEMGIRMCHAGFHYETFIDFSKQSYNFNESECSKKWQLFWNYDKNMHVMVNFLKKYDITIDYTE